MLSGGIFDSFIKYSTIYCSYNAGSPLANQTNVGFSDKIESEIIETPYDFNVSMGLRKLARYKYQVKKGNFYDGSENELTDNANIGAVTGFEYSFRYSDVRKSGFSYKEQEYWFRYLGKHYTIKAQYSEFGEQELTFAQLDIKYRKNFGQFDFTVGTSFRGRPIVIKPNVDWSDNFDAFWLLAYEMNYTDLYYEDSEGYGDYYWYDPAGNLIAETDAEFYDNIFEGVVLSYYNSLIIDEGFQYEISVAIGLDYYYYGDKFWFHTWATAYPYHHALTDYIKDMEREMDHDIGIILGWKLSKHIGLFAEGRHLSYFNTKDVTNAHYELKTGLNFVIF